MPPTYSTTRLPDVIGQDYEAYRVFRSLRTPLETADDWTENMSGPNVLWTFKLGWQYLSQTVAEQLLHAYEFVGGTTAGIYWFEWVSQTWPGVLVGKGNGTTTIFELPVKEATAGSTTVTVAGAAATPAFSAATGPNGEDRISFVTAPANNAEIRASFTGRRRRKVRVTSFKLSARPGSTSLWTASLDLIETEGAGS